MATLFVSFGVKSLSSDRKFVQGENGNLNSSQAYKLFFPISQNFTNSKISVFNL
jgi:hypothetical protein